MTRTFQARRILPPRPSHFRALTVALLIAGPLAFGLMAILMDQDANWDFRNYHYYNVYALFEGRSALDMVPAQTPTFYNPLLDIPFYLLSQLVPARLAGFALGFVQGFNFDLLFLIALSVLALDRISWRIGLAAALAAAGMLGGIGISMIGTTFGDNLVSIGVLLSAFLILKWQDRLRRDGLSAALLAAGLAGLPVGLMVGLKLPSATYAVGLCAALFFLPNAIHRRVLLASAFGVGVLGGALLTLGYWGWHLYQQFGNPLFPYFNNVFHAPLANLNSGRDTGFVPKTFMQGLLLPFTMAENPLSVAEIPWRDFKILTLYVTLPLALLAGGLATAFAVPEKGPRLADRTGTRFVLVLIVLSYLTWLVMFTVYRYAVILEMLAPLALVMIADMLPLAYRARTILALALVAMVTLTVQGGDWGRRHSWLDHFVEAEVPPLENPDDLMILMVGSEAYSHLIPFFPHQIPFVRVESNFTSPTRAVNGYTRLLFDRVAAHKAKGGRFMLLIPSWQKDQARNIREFAAGNRALSYFGLIAKEPCLAVIDRLYNDGLVKLCPVSPL